jgi:hypothetical protein
MAEPRTNQPYYALRVHPRSLSADWWAAAHLRSAEAPPAVKALLAGRTRVELSAEEAVRAIHWAAQLSGWDANGIRPLVVYPPLDAG